MTQEFHPFPEEARAMMARAAERRQAEIPVAEGGTKGKSAYKEAMERKRQRFGEGNPVQNAMPTPQPQFDTPVMYTAGESIPQFGLEPPRMNPAPMTAMQHNQQQAPQGQVYVDRSQPLGPQLMSAIRDQQGLTANVFAHDLPKPHIDPAVVQPVEAPPTMVAPRSDPKGISIDLPSKFAHYPFKDLYVSRMEGLQLEKFSKASEENSYQPMVEGLASMTDSTGTTGMTIQDSQGRVHEIPPAFWLTPQDFFYLLYYVRLHNFTRSKFIHSAVCQHEPHLEAVRKGEMPKESLIIEMFVEKTQLKMTQLETIPNPQHFPLEQQGIFLKPPVMMDVLEILDKGKIEDQTYAQQLDDASYFQQVGEYLTLDQRIDLMRTMSVDDIETIRAYAKQSIEAYGVDETIVITCKECGTSRKDHMSLDVHTFLPY